MFGALGNLGTIIKQARQLGSRVESINESLRTQRVKGTSGGGMVAIEMNGLEEVQQCTIDPALFQSGDRELAEDLVRSAVNDAVRKAKQLHADAMKGLAGGLELPGLADVLNRLSEGKNSPED